MKVRGWKAAEVIFASVGLGALAYCAGTFVEGRIYQARAYRLLQRSLHDARAKASVTAPVLTAVHRSRPPEGSVVARLEIPRLRAGLMVVEGVEAPDLKLGPGHVPSTPLPGQPGNIAIAGHRDTFFRPLSGIRKDDEIRLITAGGVDEYRVVSLEVVEPSDVRVLNPTGRDSLTLITCFPFHFVGAAPHRFIVHADRVAPSAPPPAGH